MVLPVSAYMLHHPKEYDQVLESYSRPLRTVVSITIDEESERLTINNPVEASGSYRYPDLTNQALYLLHAVEQTIKTRASFPLANVRCSRKSRMTNWRVSRPPIKLPSPIRRLIREKQGRNDQELRRLPLPPQPTQRHAIAAEGVQRVGG